MINSRVQADVFRIVASQAKVDPGSLRVDADLREDLRLRSLDILVVCEMIERAFGMTITDAEASRVMTVGAFVDLVESRGTRNAAVGTSDKQLGPPGSELREDGSLETGMEISMQLLGLNGLAETPLLMRVADLRWQHMAAVAGILTRDVVDDVGDRLYAAVFFVETCFPPARAMGTFRENDRISIVSTLERFGTSLLDGHHYIFPFEAPASSKRAPATVEEAALHQIPWLRISNSFVKKWDGAGWLKKSRPSAAGFDRIREVAEPPSSYGESAALREGGRFFDVPESYTPLSAEPIEIGYDIVPDRDMNGAGLLYFAMYPSIMDVAERRVLRDCGFEPELIDRRTLVHRKTAYFSNAPATDRVKTTMTVHIENPFRTDAPSKEMAPIRLLEEIRLNRESDGRLMAIAGAKKVILGVPLGDTKLLETLERGR